ncbi:MAG: RNA polymerase sigma factor [Terriglobales bacterium]
MGAELTAILDASLRVLDPDTELMLRFQAGEACCFDELVGRYQKPLLGFVYRMVRDMAAGEEIIQEAFMRVYQHRERYRPEARFSTLVYRIASHLALNYLRDHRRDRMATSLDEPTQDGELRMELADARPNVEQGLLAASTEITRRARVRDAIAELPGRQRAAVIMHKYQGLDYEEIAGALELSASATKSLLFRAYESLRRDLQDLVGSTAMKVMS